MISKLAEAFGFEDENSVETMMSEEDVLQAINIFFSAAGPTKILITYEPAGSQNTAPLTNNLNTKRKGSTFIESVSSSQARLRVYLQDIDYMPVSAVFFMKIKRSNNQEHFAIDPSKINDGTLTFGVIREPLESLEVVMRCVYKPVIQGMSTELWGHASSEQKNEFIQSIDTFTKGLQESIRSISGGLELKKPDPKVEELGSAAASDPALVVNSLNLLQDWCNRIEKYLDDSDRSRWETADSGPDTELDYWRNRMQRWVKFQDIFYILCCRQLLHLFHYLCLD